jgi:hypothetical protein
LSPSLEIPHGACRRECYSQEVLVPLTGVDEELLELLELLDPLVDPCEELLDPTLFPP